MGKKEKKKINISSIEEFRSIYLPKLHEEKTISTSEEAREYGAALARQALEKIKV